MNARTCVNHARSLSRRKAAHAGYGALLVMLALLLAVAEAPAAAAAEQPVVIAGDIVARTGSTTLLKATRLKGTKSITVAGRGNPAPGAAGSVFVRVRVTKATAGGRLLLGPAGGSARSVIVFPKGATTGGTLVRVGKGDRITLRATAGGPTVSVTLTAWIPKTSAFVAPSAPIAVKATRGASGAKRFAVAGKGSVPADTNAVLLAVRTTRARGPGELKAGPTGSTAVAVAAYGRGESVSLVLARPGKEGAVDVRASAGSPVVSAQVVAWAAVPSEAVGASRPVRIGRIADGARILLAGRYGIPATAVRSALVAVFSPGGSTLQVVALDAAGKGRVSTPGRSANATVVGWVANPGASTVSYVPGPGTTILGPGEIVAASESGILLDRSATVPKIDGFVFARWPGAPGAYVGRVTAVDTVGERKMVHVTTASLDEAFVDFDVRYNGPLVPALAAGASRLAVGDARTASFLSSIGLLRGRDSWSCQGAIPNPRDLIERLDLSLEDNDINLDVNLADRLVDFSVKGALVLEVTLRDGVTVSCTVSADVLEVSLPIPGTPLAVSFGPSGTLGWSSDRDGTTDLTGTARFALGFSYIDGETSLLKARNLSAEVTPSESEFALEVGVTASVGAAKLPKLDEIVDVSAGVTVGLKFALGAPESDEHGRLRGPKCRDVTANVYADVGAQAVVPFFKDVSLSIARYDFDPLSIYRGPCWGYIGTIVYTVTGGSPLPGYYYTWERGATITATPGHAARFDGNGGNALIGTVTQPFTWTAYNRDAQHWFDPGVSHCTTWKADAAGGGTRPTAFGPAWLLTFQSNGYGAGETFFDQVGTGVELPGSYSSRSSCEDEFTQHTPGPGFALSGREGLVSTPGDPAELPTLQGTSAVVDSNGMHRSVTYNLTRVEVPRQ